MTGLAWFFFVTSLLLLVWNAYLMWVNSELRRDLRRASRAHRPRMATPPARTGRIDPDELRGVILPVQPEAGER